jgi:hypothetical protein
MFSPLSRYANLETTTLEVAGERTIVYVGRRFVPQPEALALIEEHIVQLGDRIDNVAAARLGDPELFWRIADGNREMYAPDLVTTAGRRLRITLPEGFPGPRRG